MLHFVAVEDGQGLVEFALLLVLVAVVVVVSLLLFGEALADYYHDGIAVLSTAIDGVLGP